MAMRARLIGRQKHSARLKKLTSFEVDGVVGAVLYEGADMIKAEAQQSITRGAVGGRGHVASKPGETPKSNTGILMRNIEAVRSGRVEAEVRSKAPYAGFLEFGTSKMGERPYMRPARDKMLPQVRARIAEQMDKLVKRSGQ